MSVLSTTILRVLREIEASRISDANLNKICDKGLFGDLLRHPYADRTKFRAGLGVPIFKTFDFEIPAGNGWVTIRDYLKKNGIQKGPGMPIKVLKTQMPKRPKHERARIYHNVVDERDQCTRYIVQQAMASDGLSKSDLADLCYVTFPKRHPNLTHIVATKCFLERKKVVPVRVFHEDGTTEITALTPQEIMAVDRRKVGYLAY